MASSQAVRLCPHLKIAPPHWPRIHECSRQVMTVLNEYGPMELMSVDEAYVELSAWPDPAATAAQIQAEVKAATGLPASVGLATSKLVAKVASEHEKPAGCTVISPGREAIFLATLPPRALWGVGPRTAERLAALGITTCGQLAAADPGPLYGLFGKQTAELQARARGIDDRPVVAGRGQAKSISQERTFNTDVNDAEFLRRQLQKMSAEVAQSLQRRNLVAHTVYVKFRWADFTTFTRQKSVEVGVDDEGLIYRLALSIWEENWPPGRRMRLLGVGVSRLEELKGRQLGLSF
jgi:DNA polymerase-4